MGKPSIRRHRRRRTISVAIAVLVPLLAIPARADDPLDPYLGDPGRTYPNLVPNVEVVKVDTVREVEASPFGFDEGLFLKFDTRAQNLGTVPVQVTIDEVETPQSSTVSQCVSWRSAEGHVCRETELVGGYTWHDAHMHFHYEDFAAYELRSLTPDGRADWSDAGLLRTSGKVSFCFYDITWVGDIPTTAPFYTTGTCNAPVVMGVSPGWTDIYGEELEGQNIDIEGLPNGDYALVTFMNYEHTLRETNYDDDVIEVVVRISDDPEEASGRKAEILEKRWPTAAERTATTSTTTTSTSTTSTTLSTTTTTPEGLHILNRSSTFAPVARPRPAPRARECPGWHRTCSRSWTK